MKKHRPAPPRPPAAAAAGGPWCCVVKFIDDLLADDEQGRTFVAKFKQEPSNSSLDAMIAEGTKRALDLAPPSTRKG